MPDPAVPVWSVDERSLELFAKQLDAPSAPRAWFELRREAEHVALVPGFDRLITLGGHAIKELPHQIDVAQRVLRQMGGRAILADEVGLGRRSRRASSTASWRFAGWPAARSSSRRHRW